MFIYSNNNYTRLKIAKLIFNLNVESYQQQKISIADNYDKQKR